MMYVFVLRAGVQNVVGLGAPVGVNFVSLLLLVYPYLVLYTSLFSVQEYRMW